METMNFIKCVIFLIVIFGRAVKIYGNEIDHLCEQNMTGETDDGQPYNYNVFVCCEGYTQDNNGKCIPICDIPCIFGICKAPNVCECKVGYEMIKDKCVPQCRSKCVNGYCSEPDVCGCPNGFELDTKNSTFCIPVCNPKCSSFSKCTKSAPKIPNHCQCINGYAENEITKKCEPVCINKCTNGFCSAPETCKCFEGFELDNTNKTNCLPKCEPKCQANSICVAPNKCECNVGYKYNKLTGKCDSVCKDQVPHSICLEPPNKWICVENYQHDLKIDKCVLKSCLCETNGYCEERGDVCKCYEGFTKNSTSGRCEAICQPSCENAICVANNICQCLDGYHNTPADHICEQNTLCNGQPCGNGECLLTGECKCKSGFVKSFSYNGQQTCDRIQTFVAKVMTTILGVPLLLTSFALIAVFVIVKKKSYNVEEQEMMLINRN